MGATEVVTKVAVEEAVESADVVDVGQSASILRSHGLSLHCHALLKSLELRPS